MTNPNPNPNVDCNPNTICEQPIPPVVQPSCIPTTPNMPCEGPNSGPINVPATVNQPNVIGPNDVCLPIDNTNVGQTQWTFQACNLVAVSEPPVPFRQTIATVGCSLRQEE